MACPQIPSVTLWGTTQITTIIPTFTVFATDVPGSPRLSLAPRGLVTVTPTVQTTVTSSYFITTVITSVTPAQTLYSPCSTSDAVQPTQDPVGPPTTPGARTTVLQQPGPTSTSSTDIDATQFTAVIFGSPTLSAVFSMTKTVTSALSTSSLSGIVPSSSSSSSSSEVMGSAATSPAVTNATSTSSFGIAPISAPETQSSSSASQSSSGVTSAHDASSHSSSHASAGIIVGALVGALFALGALVCLCMHCRTRRLRSNCYESNQTSSQVDFWETQFRQLETEASPAGMNGNEKGADDGDIVPSRRLHLTLDLASKDSLTDRPASRLSTISSFFTSKVGPLPFRGGDAASLSKLNFSRPLRAAPRLMDESSNPLSPSAEARSYSLKRLSSLVPLNFGRLSLSSSESRLSVISRNRTSVSSAFLERESRGRNGMEWVQTLHAPDECSRDMLMVPGQGLGAINDQVCASRRLRSAFDSPNSSPQSPGLVHSLDSLEGIRSSPRRRNSPLVPVGEGGRVHSPAVTAYTQPNFLTLESMPLLPSRASLRPPSRTTSGRATSSKSIQSSRSEGITRSYRSSKSSGSGSAKSSHSATETSAVCRPLTSHSDKATTREFTSLLGPPQSGKACSQASEESFAALGPPTGDVMPFPPLRRQLSDEPVPIRPSRREVKVPATLTLGPELGRRDRARLPSVRSEMPGFAAHAATSIPATRSLLSSNPPISTCRPATPSSTQKHRSPKPELPSAAPHRPPPFSPPRPLRPTSSSIRYRRESQGRAVPELRLSWQAITPSLWVDEEMYDMFQNRLRLGPVTSSPAVVRHDTAGACDGLETPSTAGADQAPPSPTLSELSDSMEDVQLARVERAERSTMIPQLPVLRISGSPTGSGLRMGLEDWGKSETEELMKSV